MMQMEPICTGACYKLLSWKLVTNLLVSIWGKGHYFTRATPKQQVNGIFYCGYSLCLQIKTERLKDMTPATCRHISSMSNNRTTWACITLNTGSLIFLVLKTSRWIGLCTVALMVCYCHLYNVPAWSLSYHSADLGNDEKHYSANPRLTRDTCVYVHMHSAVLLIDGRGYLCQSPACCWEAMTG